MEPEIVIIGGGPAGAYCATELAKNGIYALIIDHSHPREKPCGGGISTKVLKKFPFVEQFSLKGRKTYALRLISHPPENKEIFGTNTQQRRLLISRKYLDEQLLNMAIQHGAKLIKEKVNDIQKEHNRWKILTNKGSLYAKIIVGADGVNSIVRRKTIGKPIPPEDLALTFGYYAVGIENKPPTIKYLGRIPEIGKEYLLGYIWVFPRLENSSIGIGGELRYGSKLKRVLDDFIISYYPEAKILSTFACLLPSATNPDFFKEKCAGKDWVLIGDSAGHTDPISGEGILYALWSAKLAARSIKNNELDSYDKSWKKEYGNYLIERCKMKTIAYGPLGIVGNMINFLAGNNEFY